MAQKVGQLDSRKTNLVTLGMQTEILKTLWHGGVYVICPHDSTRKRKGREITVSFSFCLFLYLYTYIYLPPADSDFNSLQQSTLSAARDSFGYFSTVSPRCPPAARSDPSRKYRKKKRNSIFCDYCKGKVQKSI